VEALAKPGKGNGDIAPPCEIRKKWLKKKIIVVPFKALFFFARKEVL
jgi:hypothetical protein